MSDVAVGILLSALVIAAAIFIATLFDAEGNLKRTRPEPAPAPPEPWQPPSNLNDDDRAWLNAHLDLAGQPPEPPDIDTQVDMAFRAADKAQRAANAASEAVHQSRIAEQLDKLRQAFLDRDELRPVNLDHPHRKPAGQHYTEIWNGGSTRPTYLKGRPL